MVIGQLGKMVRLIWNDDGHSCTIVTFKGSDSSLKCRDVPHSLNDSGMRVDPSSFYQPSSAILIGTLTVQPYSAFLKHWRRVRAL